MGLLERLGEDKKKPATPQGGATEGIRKPEESRRGSAHESESGSGSGMNTHQDLMEEIKNTLIEEMDQDLLKEKDEEKKRDIFGKKLDEILKKLTAERMLKIAPPVQKKIIEDVLDDVLGLGPIQKLLRDDSLSEIMVNGPKQVYIERKGKLVLSDVTFRDNEHVLHIIEKIIAPLGRRCDESSPMVDARLKDGSRVNAIIPPLALNGPTITIRKFKKDPLQVSDLVRWNTLTQEMADFVKACVHGRLNIVISGGTGSGKTTTLNILSGFIPEDERIITVEDAAELQLRQPHVVSLETRPPNIEGKGEVTIRDLIKNTLRMRPERVVVGECRGGEALDMLQAMNTGHDGSLTTGHANTPRDMIRRLETMVMMSGMDLPVKAIRENISSAIHLIVQQSRLQDGSRKVTHITEVQGMEGETVVLQDIFIFEAQGLDEKGKIIGKLKPTGIRPKFMDKLISHGQNLPADIFTEKL
ncbi:MAG: CpaF family protein [Candidatus Wallbacteria bacterium]|nr:CpaF family protein [Candidatus Wallbacteria bacterium]